jgi:hypothetical protein
MTLKGIIKSAPATDIPTGSKIKVSRDQIKYDAYVKKGNMLCLREALSPHDPDHLYNYLKANGITPEEYGIFHPITEKYKDFTREQLLAKLYDLEVELENAYKYL